MKKAKKKKEKEMTASIVVVNRIQKRTNLFFKTTNYSVKMA